MPAGENRRGLYVLNGSGLVSMTSPPAHANGQLGSRRQARRSPAGCVEQRDISLHVASTVKAAAGGAGPVHLADPTRTDRSPVTLSDEINRLACELRGIIQRLDEGLVRDFDLTVELETLKAFYEDIGRVRITLDLQASAMALLTREEEREILVFVRQALSDYVRHTRATRATVSIRRRGARFRIHVSDEGTGSADVRGQSLDGRLSNMEARAKNLGGVFRIQSPRSGGTRITLEFSLEPILVVL